LPVATAISTTSGIPMVYMATSLLDTNGLYWLYFAAFD
jgi:hypothetical protein